ncbi:MAG: hypothetical protein K6G47_06105 [Clostridia bacterium]|nr:hypothetical protein [Clostridia bacterium]
MKLLKTVLAAALTVALLGAAVFAAEGDDGKSSPTQGDGPKVVSATDASGKDITGQIVTTRMGTKSDIAKINEYLDNAKKDLDAVSNKPTALKNDKGATLEADLQKALDAQNANAKAADLTIMEVFDASYVEGDVVKPLDGPVTITFEQAVPSNSAVVVIHNEATGVWEVVDSSKVKIENGKVTVTLDSLSPIAFLTTPINPTATPTATPTAKADDTVKSAQTGEHVAIYVLIIAAALAVAGGVCIKRAKGSNK